MSTDSLIDELATRLDRAGLLIGRIDSAPWIDAFEQRLPRRLPRSFGSLIRRYAFAPFEWGPLFIFGNSGKDDERDFSVAVLRDSGMWDTMLNAGFVQFARPRGGSYDAICFDMRDAARNREYPILRLDHESVLIKPRIHILEQIARSFVVLIEDLLASDSEPVAD
jgi:hypothetical protein